MFFYLNFIFKLNYLIIYCDGAFSFFTDLLCFNDQNKSNKPFDDSFDKLHLLQRDLNEKFKFEHFIQSQSPGLGPLIFFF